MGEISGVGDQRSSLRKLLSKDRFPEMVEYIEGRVWLVVAPHQNTTTEDIVEDVMKAAEGKDDVWPLYFVTKVRILGHFNGIADSSLWELEAWEDTGYV